MQMTGDETAPQKALVEFREIGKTYPNGTVALRNVSFQVIEGDILAVWAQSIMRDAKGASPIPMSPETWVSAWCISIFR